MKKIHLKLTENLSQCGYYSDNLTDNIEEITCKFCQKLLLKHPRYIYLNNRIYDKLVNHSI